MRGKIFEIDSGDESLNIIKALASESRMKILEILNKEDMNLNEISERLDMPAPSVTVNIKKLEEAGLIETEYQPGSHGSQKICRRSYDSLLVRLPGANITEQNIIELSMPIGNYKDFEVEPSCGLATERNYLGILDDTQAFLDPQHIYAQLLWFKQGYVTYKFPNNLPTNTILEKLAFSMEICSEFPVYNEDWPSDITVWINDVEIGTWTSPGDFGEKRGKLNPSWWQNENTQYGLLKVWAVSQEGSFIDGHQISDKKISDLHIEDKNYIELRIGVKDDARNIGGLNLFGRKFGNYAQDIIMRMKYSYE